MSSLLFLIGASMQWKGSMQSGTAAQPIPGKAQCHCGRWCAEIWFVLRRTSVLYRAM